MSPLLWITASLQNPLQLKNNLQNQSLHVADSASAHRRHGCDTPYSTIILSAINDLPNHVDSCRYNHILIPSFDTKDLVVNILKPPYEPCKPLAVGLIQLTHYLGIMQIGWLALFFRKELAPNRLRFGKMRTGNGSVIAYGKPPASRKCQARKHNHDCYKEFSHFEKRDCDRALLIL